MERENKQPRKFIDYRLTIFLIAVSIIGGIIVTIGVIDYVLGIKYLDENMVEDVSKSIGNYNCVQLKGFIQQNSDHHDWVMVLLKSNYKDKCGDPDSIPKQRSVTPTAENISALTKDDINQSSLDGKHTVVIDCIVYDQRIDTNKSENDKFFDLMKKNDCLTNSTGTPFGHWNYFK